ncbi:F-box protein KIB2-like [Cornus florida]|uniref:F-box protein KIB2-like n=1 Tax=Cornus florida TaxID=4283 RepID=UPI0028A26D23|nr:F-box protein KIB2-like [Cornus florida]
MIANKTHLVHPTKRRKTSSPSSPPSSSTDWSRGLHTDSWESILNRLSAVELLDQPPLLMLPCHHDQDNKNSRCLYNLAEKKVYKQLTNIPKVLGHTRCIGSSHGWLIFLDDQKAIPYILNPFLEVWIELPIFRVTGDIYRTFEKAVLSADPIHSDNTYWVVVIYGVASSKLAFSRCGGSEWTALNGVHQPYCDIIFHNHHIFALGETGSVEIWDFNTSLIPTKKMDIRPSFPRSKFEFENVLVREADLLLEEDNPMHLVCPYMTKVFHVYKLDFDLKKWVELEYLGDCMLFLGGNHSISLSHNSFPNWKGNSVYFTDDNWDRMNGGHDTGRFDLEDQRTELINEDDLQKIEPAPIWIVPNPC